MESLIGVLGRRLLLVFVLVALLPIAVTVGLSYLSARDVVAGLLEENIGTTARLYAAEVDDFLSEQTALLTALAGGLQAKDAVLTEVVKGSPMVLELIVLNREGTLVAHSQAEPGWAVDACRSDLQLSLMKHAHHGEGHEVVVAVPRQDGGRLCGRVSFTLHQAMMSERARNTFGGLAYIVDRSGTVVCHAFEEDEPHVHPGQAIDGPAAEHARAGVAWTGVVETEGVPVLAAYAPASNLPWGVWAEVPMAQASVALRPLTARALGIGVVQVLVLSGVILVIVRRIAGPIEELATASQRIAAGAVGETVPVHGDDEIATLAREFNKMSRALAESVRDLDGKVAQRTVELDEARHFSDTLLDTLEQRILVISPDLRVIRANRAAVLAYGSDLVGRACAELQPPSCPAGQVFETNQVMAEETTRRDAQGRAAILSVVRYPVPGPDGPQAVLQIERDVTELKQFQARLVHQEKMAALGTLAAGLAHEIGNPLASLSSELELLALDPAGATESLPVLQNQVRRMRTLLRELVDLGRPPVEHRERFEAMAVVDDVLRLLRHSARDQGVELERHQPDQAVTLCTSRDRLVQVLLNLGLNAVDAASGRVWFEVRPVGEGVHFIVGDDGPGIPEQDQARLFEPFFTTKPVGEGTGLGLFVVDRIISSMQGRVHATNGPQGGAVFTIEFPDCSCGGSDG